MIGKLPLAIRFFVSRIEEKADPLRWPMKNNITMAMHWIVLGCSPGDSSCVIVEDEINATIVRPLPYGVKLHAIVECDMLMEFVKDFKGTAQILEKGYVTDIQDNRKDVVVEHSSSFAVLKAWN
ncbi:unnamed protein product [Brassica rapa subsp. trilocularis]